MAKNKANEVALSLSKSVREANQAIADSIIAAQERNLKFAQSILENGIEVLKSYAEDTRTLTQELVEQPQKQQGVFQSLADSAVTTQERNVKFAQSVIRSGTEVLKSHAEDTRTLMQTLAEQSQKQQEAFQVLAREAWDAYVDFLSAPFSNYEQALDTAESIASQGVETAQKIAHQGLETAQKAVRQEKQAATTTK